MKLKISRYCLIIISLLFSLIFYSCDTSQAPTEPSTITMPAFTDNIPYSALGSGKIAFERIGPQDNAYLGLVIIDLNKATVNTYNGTYLYPCLSPNGDKIAFSGPSYVTYSFDICVMNIDGTGLDDISGTLADDRFPAWSPDQQKIFFYYSPLYTTGIQDLVVQSPSSAAQNQQLLQHFNYAVGPISISSQKIVYNAFFSPSGIYTTNLDGSSPSLILAAPANRNLESPCFSPDGNSIAYLSVDRDTTGLYHSVEVKIMNTDGTSPKSIVTVPAGGSLEWDNPDQVDDVSVCWSPDGRKLLFVVHENDLESHVYVVNADGTGLTKVTTLAGITDRKVSWSK